MGTRKKYRSTTLFFRNLCEFYYQHDIYFLFIRLKNKIKTIENKKEVNPNLHQLREDILSK